MPPKNHTPCNNTITLSGKLSIENVFPLLTRVIFIQCCRTTAIIPTQPNRPSPLISRTINVRACMCVCVCATCSIFSGDNFDVCRAQLNLEILNKFDHRSIHVGGVADKATTSSTWINLYFRESFNPYLCPILRQLSLRGGEGGEK